MSPNNPAKTATTAIVRFRERRFLVQFPPFGSPCWRPYLLSTFNGLKIMMKKSTLLGALLAAASVASVHAGEFQGTYAGLFLGSNTSSATNLADKSSTYLGLKAGYSWNFDQFLLGAEGFYDAHDQSYTKDDAGLDARLGLPLNRWLPYVKLGMATTTPGERLHGGVGVEYSLTDSWSLNAEWTADSKDADGVNNKNSNIGIGLNYQYGGARRSAAAERAAAEKAAAERAAAEKAAAEKAAAEKAAAEKALAGKSAAEKAAYEKAAAEKAAAEKAAASKKAADPTYKTVYDEKKITLEGTSFASGSAVLNRSASAGLDKAIQFANANKEADLVVSGYTDDRGDAAKNLTLSAARADAVKNYLIKHGVAAERLSSKGEGSANPVADNKTAAGRAKNRRVEINAVVKEAKQVLVQ